MRNKIKTIGAGIGMAALAAAKAYFVYGYGRRGAKNRGRIAGWALRFKGEVLEKMENLKEIDRQAYDELIDETAGRYGRVKRVSASELKNITVDLKKAWTHIGKQL